MLALDAQVQAVLDEVRQRRPLDRLLVAFSGGLDSTVLLQLIVDYGASRDLGVIAFHVDHGLQADSASWAKHCANVAASLAVNYVGVRLHSAPPPGASVEQWARDQRYRALAEHADVRTAVLTAHHRDDQAETVLQRVFSGAGPHGLGGMRTTRPLADALLVRPLLTRGRAELAAYATARGLHWILDPSNADPRFLRNRIRREIMPALTRIMPAASASLAEFASIQAELATALDTLCDQALARDGLPAHLLATTTLRAFAPALQPYLLKRWLLRAGAPAPGRRQLRQIQHNLLDARNDATPLVQWADYGVRRFGQWLYVTSVPLPLPPPAPLSWQPQQILRLPWGWLSAHSTTACGLDREALATLPVTVGFRRGGEWLRVVGSRHRQALKKLFQQWQVPPWERGLTPLVFLDQQLAAVAGHCICADFATAERDRALVLNWQWRLYPLPS